MDTQMKIDPYCQWQNCSPLHVLLAMYRYIDVAGHSSTRSAAYNQNTVGESRYLQALYVIISRKW